MTPTLTVNLLRTLFVTFTICVGATVGLEMEAPAVGIAIGAVFGLLVVLADRMMQGVSLRVFSSATFGLLVGFIFSKLLLSSNLLIATSGQVQWIVGLIVYCTFGYLGMMLALRSNRDELSLIIPYVRFRRATVQDAPLVIDEHVIIDGRIADLCATGFISSSLVIPRGVVQDLQKLAESEEPVKRERGRSALDRLQTLQKNPSLSVTIHDGDPDASLVKLASVLGARLLTTDANLCSVARVQNVPALNLTDLVRAMKPVMSAGDEFDLSLVKEGRDAHQAVGYLPDGTMVVVNHANAYIGRTMRVVIGSSLQTSAGRLFFAELKNESNAAK